jgi:hypothetical protein
VQFAGRFRGQFSPRGGPVIETGAGIGQPSGIAGDAFGTAAKQCLGGGIGIGDTTERQAAGPSSPIQDGAVRIDGDKAAISGERRAAKLQREIECFS